MSVNVLGVSAYYHDSAAVLVRDGEIVAAIQEERLTRKRHDARFPRHAIDYCLGEGFIDPSEIDAVVFYDNPLLTLDRVVRNAVSVAPRGRESSSNALASMLRQKTNLADHLEECLGFVPRLLGTTHHLAHAASAFYPSPYDRAAILTIDGVGEWATCTIGRGEGADVALLEEVRYPHSLGLLYSAFTYFCGFKVNSGEYKLMGLAPYGQPRYADLIRRELIDIRDDGSFRLNTAAFGFLDSATMTNERFDALFDGPPRSPESPITSRELDLAASVQVVTEEVVLRLARHATERAGSRNLVMAGGVALNCVANGRVQRELPLDGLFVQPAAGDAGGALGAALLASHRTFDVPRPRTTGRDRMKGAGLGPAFSPEEIAAFVEREQADSDHVADPDARAAIVAQALADGQVVGFFSGRMEFGPRALGARSILGDPRDPDMQRRMNQKIKYRESFRPFAPAVLEEHAADYFDMTEPSPYMLHVAPISARHRCPTQRSAADGDALSLVINEVRSVIPAVTHVDFSARVQTVGEEANAEFRQLLRAFHALTGCPMLINTSFNVRGEPIVCTPRDAYRCFMRTDMDLLVLGDRLLWKDRQTASADDTEWEAEYELD